MPYFIGTYTAPGGRGILSVSEEDGAWRVRSVFSRLRDMNYLLLSRGGRALYAVGRAAVGDPVAAGFSVAGDELTLRSLSPTGGEEPCHLALDAEERHLYTANYNGGSVSVFDVADGRVLGRTQLVRLPESRSSHPRQEMAHPHQCVFRPGTRELFVCDLGLDAVHVFGADAQSGRLTRLYDVPVPPQMGPRHLVFASPDRFYVTGELDNHAARFERTAGGWRLAQRIPTLPPDFSGVSTTAAIRLRGGTLGVSNRGHDSVCLFDVLPDGTLAAPRWIPTGGRSPRDFQILGDGRLLVAHEVGGGLRIPGGPSLEEAGTVAVCPY